MEGGTEMKAPDFDDQLQSSSAELPSPERPGEPLSVGDGAISPAIDGNGASSRLLLPWSRQFSLSSSQGSSSSEIEVDIEVEIEFEVDNRYRHPQSEFEEIASPRWLSLVFTPPGPATHQLESEEPERAFFSDALSTAGNKYVSAQKFVITLRMTDDKMRVKAMKIAAVSDGVMTVSLQRDKSDNSDQLVAKGAGLTTRVRGRMASSTSTVKRLFNRLFNYNSLFNSAKPAGTLSAAQKYNLAVVGNGVDPVVLLTRLKKHMVFAKLISVSPMKWKEEKKEQKKEEKKEAK